MKCISYCVDKRRDDARTGGHTDRQTQATIHKGQDWPRVKVIHAIMNFQMNNQKQTRTFQIHFISSWNVFSLQRRHNGREWVSNHQPHYCLLNRVFKRRSNKTPKLRVTGPCAGNLSVTGGLPHKWPGKLDMFPLDDVIMCHNYVIDNKSTKRLRTDVTVEIMKVIAWINSGLTHGRTDTRTDTRRYRRRQR